MPSEEEIRIADVLQRVWFATLVGWSNGLHAQPGIVEHTRNAAELLLRGRGLGPLLRGAGIAAAPPALACGSLRARCEPFFSAAASRPSSRSTVSTNSLTISSITARLGRTSFMRPTI